MQYINDLVGPTLFYPHLMISCKDRQLNLGPHLPHIHFEMCEDKHCKRVYPVIEIKGILSLGQK